MNARVSKRLVRSFLRYLREREGPIACAQLAAGLPPASAAIVTDPNAAPDFIPLDDWLAVLRAFEQRFGDPATLRLLRETTRSCMAVAVAKGWSAFMADVTPGLLLERTGTLWHQSYSAGELVTVSPGPPPKDGGAVGPVSVTRHARLAIEGWPDPPPEVVASVCEACVVFLVRLGERGARAIETVDAGRAEIDVTW
jgi:hypothetical protein